MVLYHPDIHTCFWAPDCGVIHKFKRFQSIWISALLEIIANDVLFVTYTIVNQYFLSY